MNEAEAFESEVALIDLFGRKCDGGCLLNLTLGGEGVSGATIHDAAYRALLSKKMKGNRYGKANKGWQGHLGNQFRTGILHSDEAKNKISESLAGNKYRLGIPHTEETREHLSEVLSGRPKSEQTRRRMLASWTPERRAKQAEWKRRLEEEKFLRTVAWG